ncbi:MAG: hypothetical protein SZ59_C0003G0073 [candidate division TM6 bacterium GW2011_GWF2_28_16]|nr:MAG: hypothetical protein SZ59_C0003G0073 [candidate division TM6 bacterium GW2011_GWF2_28_16]
MKNSKKDIKINKKMGKKHRIIVFFTSFLLLFTILLGVILFNYYKKQPKITNIVPKKYTQEKITVFTHGSFGSVIGLMNLFKVLDDNVDNTKYKKTVSKMRKNPDFYSSQTIMQKGLIKIEPTFDLASTSNTHFAAYPIIKAYEQFDQENNKNINNNFYTFGWSGLLSQNRRRLEAVRFYNSLSEELENYKSFEKIPEIRIITHSHGGNLALNLAAVHTVINNFENIDLILKNTINNDEHESLKCMYEIIKALPKKSAIKAYTNQKKYDYFPENKNLIVNELLMFGCPVQPETESFILNNFFKNIYSIYSQEDVIQDLDVFSTKKDSKRRFKIIKNIDTTKIKDKPKFVQLKIMTDREMQKVIVNTQQVLSLDTTTTQPNRHYESFWQKLFSPSRMFCKKSKDPTHKELWFVSWNKLKDKTSEPLECLPSVIFTPLILKSIENISNNTQDLDINIRLTSKNLKVYVFKHKEKIKLLENKVAISKNFVNSIKSKLLDWAPSEHSIKKDFETIKNYQAQN